MNNKLIIDTFYKYVLPGALQGEIDCDFLVHIIFNVSIEGNIINAKNIFNIENIPTLKINNKKEFDEALIKYIYAALEFYKDKIKNIPEDKKIAYLEALAFVPMGINDYDNPEEYLTKLTSVIEVCPIDIKEDFTDYGNILALESNMLIKIDKEKPSQEAPYKFMIILENDNEEYSLQTIRFYIHEDTVYIGAIQHEQKKETKTKGKINRKLFKANENISKDSPLIETNPGSIVALTAFISYMNSLGYKTFKTSPINIQREIDKKILIYKLSELIQTEEETDTKRHKVIEIIEKSKGQFTRIKVARTQLNNTLKRFAYHFSNNVSEVNDEITIQTEDIKKCNSRLLEEVYRTIFEEQKKLT